MASCWNGILLKLTHLVYTFNAKKRDITVLKARGKRALADVIMLLQNDVSHGVRRCNAIFTLRQLIYLLDFFSAMAESWKMLCFRLLLCVRIEIDQLYCVNSVLIHRVSVSRTKKQTFTLHARDLIFFTTNLQTVNNYSTIHC